MEDYSDYSKHSARYLALEALFFHCWISKWEGEEIDCSYFAQKLDALCVPWVVQNRIADCAYSDRNSIHRYFSSMLDEVLRGCNFVK